LYSGLFNHFELQKRLTSMFECCSFVDHSSSEIDESSLSGLGEDEGEESSEIETGNTQVVDRVPACHLRSKNNENNSNESSTIGGGTVKVTRSPIDCYNGGRQGGERDGMEELSW